MRTLKSTENCSETALKLLWNCSETALKLLWNCSEMVFVAILLMLMWLATCNVLKSTENCSESALKVLWKCSESAEEVARHVDWKREKQMLRMDGWHGRTKGKKKKKKKMDEDENVIQIFYLVDWAEECHPLLNVTTRTKAMAVTAQRLSRWNSTFQRLFVGLFFYSWRAAIEIPYNELDWTRNYQSNELLTINIDEINQSKTGFAIKNLIIMLISIWIVKYMNQNIVNNFLKD